MRQIVILTLVFAVFLFSCNPKSQKNLDSWSSQNTLSVPYEIRKSQLEKGNLVPNFSFEKGTDTEHDSCVKNFKLEGWTVSGKHVEWVYTDLPVYKNDSVSDGKHAIKISRKVEDISDFNTDSEGVLSDFIEVLPGNYTFLFDIRLKDVYPSVKRLNARLGTDIDIRLKFFDKNKKQLPDGMYFEYAKKELDNSFKGFSFSNLYEIEEFGWGRIIGRTLNYPFSEGDLPDGCRYVKIYLGFKGIGTMWVDNVDYRYSKWNFTSLERVRPFFDSTFHKADLVVPTPQEVKNKSEISLKDKQIVMILPEKMTAAEKAAQNLLAEHFDKYKYCDTAIFTNLAYQPKENELVIALGKNYLSENSKIDLSDLNSKEQGYKILLKNNVVYLLGVTDIGTFYAATTFVQLLDAENDKIDIADITDYPDFTGRSSKLVNFENDFTLEHDTTLTPEQRNERRALYLKNIEMQPQLIDYYAFYKINKLYNNYGELSKQWWQPGEIYTKLYETAGAECAKLGGVIQSCIQINPYLHFEYESSENELSDSLRAIFSHSNPKDIDKMYAVIETALKNGSRTLMVCADDFVPHAGKARGEYTLFTDADKKAYYNMAHAQNDMMNKLKAKIDAKYKDVRYEFCPAPYLNQFIDYSKGSAEAFFRDLSSHLDPSFAVIWTGNTVRSLSYDEADIFRYSRHIKRKPMIWDNTPYARFLEGEYGGYPAHYPGKAVMCSLFEPFDIFVTDNFTNLLDSHYYSNNGGMSALNLIQNATFADFTWNVNDYDADFSLFKVLVSQYGKENALILLEYNDAYYKFVALWAEIRNGIENQTKEKPYSIPSGYEARGLKQLSDLAESLKALDSLKDERLKKELSDYLKQKKDAFDTMLKTQKAAEKQGHRQT